MSEMKPVARVDGRWSDGRAMVRTLEAGANMPLSTELYTADQLAEAVAAEREPHVHLLTVIRWLLDHGDDCETDRAADIKKIQASITEHLEAIRSAAK
ncbi:hypothetical protein [Gluconobacter oxydans]|uniref:hypothetical protein n=1 Tax=Gluconobacter oxydans TaxID=442 RepID=UPI00062C25C6|nr:hypothetical protein [Gluconobacter oxydans]